MLSTMVTHSASLDIIILLYIQCEFFICYFMDVNCYRLYKEVVPGILTLFACIFVHYVTLSQSILPCTLYNHFRAQLHSICITALQQVSIVLLRLSFTLLIF